MRFSEDKFSGEAQAKCLLVFLPGSGDRAEHFRRNGFVKAVRARGLSVDLISADATNTYYWKRSVTQRLEEDVIGPARARGYQETWLVGNSLGGMGSLSSAQRRPGQLQGILALAPFPGPDDGVKKEVRASGGLASWEPGPATDGEAFDGAVWRWLKDVTVKGEAGPELFVGWGEGDKFARDDAMMSAALPKDRVFVSKGGHNWKTWRGLFDQFLERSTFAQRCAP